MKKILPVAVIAIIFISIILIGLQFGIINPKKLVDNFPKVPTYPTAILQKSTSNDVQGMLFRADWTSSDSVPKIMNWYISELQKDGWNLSIPPGDPNSTSIQYAEFTRGLFNSWLSKLQLSIEADKNTHKSKIEISFPAPDSEREEN